MSEIKKFTPKLLKSLSIKLLMGKCRRNTTVGPTTTNPYTVTLHLKAVITLSFPASLSLFSYGKRAGLTLTLHYYSQLLNQ